MVFCIVAFKLKNILLVFNQHLKRRCFCLRMDKKQKTFWKTTTKESKSSGIYLLLERCVAYPNLTSSVSVFLRLMLFSNREDIINRRVCVKEKRDICCLCYTYKLNRLESRPQIVYFCQKISTVSKIFSCLFEHRL